MPQLEATKGRFTIEPSTEDVSAFGELAGLMRPRDGRRSTRRSPSERDASITVNGREVRLPSQAQELLGEIFNWLASGEEVMVVPAREELTTTEAAKILNVSRQYLVRLCNEDKIPYRKEGNSHRRLALQDVLAYREQRDKEREARFANLVRKSAQAGEYDLDIAWPPQE